MISVVIPAYNAAAYIGKCLYSLAKVSGLETEFIIVNDGSTDATSEIVRKYTANDSRFKLIESSHRGTGASRNTGVELAKGEYISFVDADDEVSPDMFEVLYQNALECDADITACRATSIDSDGHIGQPLKCWNFQPGIYTRSRITACDFLNNICSPVLWDKLVKREIAKKCLSPTLRRGQDFITLIKMIYASNCIRIIDKSLYFYRHHEKSTMAEPLSESTIVSDFETEKEAIRIIRKYWCDTVLAESYEKRVIKQWMEIACTPQYSRFRSLIATKLDEVLKN